MIAIASIVMAVLLAISELTCKHVRRVEQMRLKAALWVGLAQVGALIPSVSRSGSTPTGAMFLTLRREDAAQFLCLLGLPAITLAGLKKPLVVWHAQIPRDAWQHLLQGLAVGGASAFAAIWGLMKFREKFSTWTFVAYRGLVGLFLLIALSVGWLV